jgi:hypothetical protein
MFNKLAFAALASALVASPAAAVVTYNFTALSSFPSWGQGGDESVSGGFTFSVATPITTTTTIPVVQLTSCSMIASISGALPCSDQSFIFGITPNTVTVSFSSSGFGVYYYFDEIAATTDGTWNTVFFGTDQQGILVTSGASRSVVPEPASWAMLIAGFGLTGAAMRRRRSSAVAT